MGKKKKYFLGVLAVAFIFSLGVGVLFFKNRFSGISKTQEEGTVQQQGAGVNRFLMKFLDVKSAVVGSGTDDFIPITYKVLQLEAEVLDSPRLTEGRYTVDVGLGSVRKIQVILGNPEEETSVAFITEKGLLGSKKHSNLAVEEVVKYMTPGKRVFLEFVVEYPDEYLDRLRKPEAIELNGGREIQERIRLISEGVNKLYFPSKIYVTKESS